MSASLEHRLCLCSCPHEEDRLISRHFLATWLFGNYQRLKHHYVIHKCFHLLFVPTKGCCNRISVVSAVLAMRTSWWAPDIPHLQESSALERKDLLVCPPPPLNCSPWHIIDLSWSICIWCHVYICPIVPHTIMLSCFLKCCFIFFVFPLCFIFLCVFV